MDGYLILYSRRMLVLPCYRLGRKTRYIYQGLSPFGALCLIGLGEVLGPRHGRCLTELSGCKALSRPVRGSRPAAEPNS